MMVELVPVGFGRIQGGEPWIPLGGEHQVVCKTCVSSSISDQQCNSVGHTNIRDYSAYGK